jgi:hypothetical protein
LNDKSDLANVLKDLFQDQNFAVLALLRDGHPYNCLVAFAVTVDLKHLIFATDRETRKYQNLIKDGRVSLLIDNSSNRASDIRQSIAVTALGEAEEAREPGKKQFLDCYLCKQPHMKEFACSPSTALFKIAVHKYIIVSDFQNIQEYTSF